MTKKEFLWLLLAAAVFVGAGLVGVYAARDAVSADSLGRLFEAAEDAAPAAPYVALVDVSGDIVYSSDPASALSGGGFDLYGTIDFIESLIDDENNLGMLLYVDSPGGEMGAADDLYYALTDYKTLTGRPIYCYFGSYACSGGYYIAMPADEIYADRNCMCVNIGVYVTTYNLSGLMEKYGVEQVVFRSSDNKGIGMAGVPWTDEQREIYQSIVDLDYQQFLEVVAEGRGWSVDEVREKNDGREMLASQALEAGFIDGIARCCDYEELVMSRFPEGTELYEPEYALSPFEELFYALRSLAPRTEADELRELLGRHSELKVMAYAGY